MRILWSDDPEAPAAYREAIAKAGHPRAILIVERGDASEVEISNEITNFIKRETGWPPDTCCDRGCSRCATPAVVLAPRAT
jgi:hypothetical protein